MYSIGNSVTIQYYYIVLLYSVTTVLLYNVYYNVTIQCYYTVLL